MPSSSLQLSLSHREKRSVTFSKFRSAMGRHVKKTAVIVLKDDRAAKERMAMKKRQPNDDTIEKFPVSPEGKNVSNEIEKFLSADEFTKAISGEIVDEQRNDEIEYVIKISVESSARDDGSEDIFDGISEMVPSKTSWDAAAKSTFSIKREHLSVNSSDLESIEDYVGPSLSSVSASEMPVKENQPLGGPKYYVATITKAGQAKVIHEAMPTNGVDLQAVEEEKGFEIMEYHLARKEKEPSSSPLSNEKEEESYSLAGWFERAICMPAE